MNYELRKSKLLGFTLIELLVVLSVMAIIGVVGLAALVNYSRAQVLKTSARELRTNLRLAQNKAVTQEKPDPNIASCTQLVGYKLEFSGNTYKIKRSCTLEEDTSIREFNLPNKISKIAGPDSITFKAGTGVVDIAQDSVITLSSSFGGTETITITKNGAIQ